MPSGGARNKSGPAKSPTSRTSERAGYTLTALPSEGYRGRAPAFPMPKITRYRTVSVDGTKYREADTAASTLFRRRELEIWRDQWRTPQACAWSQESWRWPTVAEFCRLKTVVELEPDANAALVGQLHRFRDQVGLTPAGMKENGWAIAPNQLAAKRAEQSPASAPVEGDEVGAKRERRMR